ncbi:MAG: VWA domain-containing protein [Phycisphaerales bacterium JB038]
MRWLDPTSLNWLLLLPLAAVLFLRAGRARTRALQRFVSSPLVASLAAGFSKRAAVAKAILVVTALGLVVLALARPAWNPQPVPVSRSGRDIVFLVDVSRSMLAEDLKPNRLERAKLAIQDVTASLAGDRVALVAFAGRPVVKCPLTTDYGFFRLALEELSVDSVTRGGSMIGDAIRLALSDAFDAQQAQYRDIILLTDGEDQGSFPVEAAGKAGQLGVRLIALGLGDDGEGSLVPVPDGQGGTKPLTYEGDVVRSRLEGELLRQTALASADGRYLHVATGNINLDRVYAELVKQAERRQIEAEEIVRYEEKYQLFLAGAFLLLLVEMCLGERRKGALR